MINELGKRIHENNVEKGFYESPKNIGEMLCLIHSEVSEALEADRKGLYMPGAVKDVVLGKEDDEFQCYYKHIVKGTFEEEMADIAIRLFDLCTFKNIDLEKHIQLKMRFNSLREKYHGKKY